MAYIHSKHVLLIPVSVFDIASNIPDYKAYIIHICDTVMVSLSFISAYSIAKAIYIYISCLQHDVYNLVLIDRIENMHGFVQSKYFHNIPLTTYIQVQ